jgi:hypothetical protein
MQSAKKVPGPPPILTFIARQENISYLFNNILSPILNNACQTAHLVVEDALHFTESELIPNLRNRLFDFIHRVKLAIFQDSLQHSKKPKVVGADV